MKSGVEITPAAKQPTSIVISGPSQPANECKAEIMEYLFRHKTGTVSLAIYPKLWVQQANNLALVNVTYNSTEWTTVQQRFNQTLKNKIHKIERIQNKWLWEKVFNLFLAMLKYL